MNYKNNNFDFKTFTFDKNTVIPFKILETNILENY